MKFRKRRLHIYTSTELYLPLWASRLAIRHGSACSVLSSTSKPSSHAERASSSDVALSAAPDSTPEREGEEEGERERERERRRREMARMWWTGW